LPIPAAEPAATDPAATPGSTAPGGTASPSASQQAIATVITFLQAQVGKPYEFNADGPETYDCSGLVSAAYEQIGISLPHQSLLQSTKGTAVDWLTQPLLPGDLVFMYSTANPTVISHVGIVFDSGRWIQAAGSGTPVRIGPLPNAAKIRAVRRIVQP
jgi:cell wall-associated NlpC family hydrolase